jgi:hypothetical protein
MTDIEDILAEAERLPDPHARALVHQLATAMVELVGAGMARVTELADVRRLADDPIVANLLVLCDLHPDPPAVRVARALASLPGLDGVDAIDGGVRVRVRGGSPPERVRAHVESVVASCAPDADVVVVEIDGVPAHLRLKVLP